MPYLAAARCLRRASRYARLDDRRLSVVATTDVVPAVPVVPASRRSSYAFLLAIALYAGFSRYIYRDTDIFLTRVCLPLISRAQGSSKSTFSNCRRSRASRSNVVFESWTSRGTHSEGARRFGKRPESDDQCRPSDRLTWYIGYA